MPISIVDYNPDWPEAFTEIRSELAEILGSLVLRIDHIGSTAVPGLGAKDIIDIQVTVRALVPEIRERLAAAGYVFQADKDRDHVPLGEEPDPRLWAKFLFVEPPGRRRSNIHVRVKGNPNQRYALLLRDFLRAHPTVAGHVETIKRELARRHPEDADAYYDIKDPVYDLVWEAAKAWAT